MPCHGCDVDQRSELVRCPEVACVRPSRCVVDRKAALYNRSSAAFKNQLAAKHGRVVLLHIRVLLDELRNGDLIYFSAQYDYTIIVFIIQKVCTPVTV